MRSRVTALTSHRGGQAEKKVRGPEPWADGLCRNPFSRRPRTTGVRRKAVSAIRVPRTRTIVVYTIDVATAMALLTTLVQA